LNNYQHKPVHSFQNQDICLSFAILADYFKQNTRYTYMLA